MPPKGVGFTDPLSGTLKNKRKVWGQLDRAIFAVGGFLSDLAEDTKLMRPSQIDSIDPAIASILARIRRSLDDPRPDMTLAEVDAHLTALFARASQTGNQTPSA